MWSENQEQLREKNLPGAGIKESGCYECKIERAELFKSTVNKSEALILTLRAIEKDKVARIPIFYKNFCHICAREFKNHNRLSH